MILIVDSGGTKTHWSLVIDKKNKISLKTPGINPYYQNSEQIFNDLHNNLTREILNKPVTKIFFYGAGCSTKEKQEVVSAALKKVFKDANVIVDGDLLGAARSLCQQKAGIACVIGTGSGSCIYDGKNIIANIPSLGYILGDEGSGAYLGKRLLQDYLRGDMPQRVISKLKSEFEISKEVVLENVNMRPMAGRYLGSFSEFLTENIKLEYVQKLIHNSFKDFVIRYIEKYPDYKNHKTYFSGSIAYFFREILVEVLNKHNVQVGNIINSPMDGLIKFHLDQI